MANHRSLFIRLTCVFIFSGIRQRHILKEDEMMYVPLLDSLQLMLNKPSIVHEVRLKPCLSVIIKSVKDAEFFKLFKIIFIRSYFSTQRFIYVSEREGLNRMS